MKVRVIENIEGKKDNLAKGVGKEGRKRSNKKERKFEYREELE